MVITTDEKPTPSETRDPQITRLEHISTELIAPEQVRRAGWTEPRGKYLRVGVVRRDLAGKHGDQDRGEQYGAADEDALIAHHAEHESSTSSGV